MRFLPSCCWKLFSFPFLLSSFVLFLFFLSRMAGSIGSFFFFLDFANETMHRDSSAIGRLRFCSGSGPRLDIDTTPKGRNFKNRFNRLEINWISLGRANSFRKIRIYIYIYIYIQIQFRLLKFQQTMPRYIFSNNKRKQFEDCSRFILYVI